VEITDFRGSDESHRSARTVNIANALTKARAFDVIKFAKKRGVMEMKLFSFFITI